MNPEITVIMSVFNGSRSLTMTVDSILSQTMKEFEFIIIDDCSTDDTSRLLGSCTDKRVKVMTNDENIGLTRSLNAGLAEAKGKYIARVDCGDVAYPNRLREQADYLDGHPDIFLVGGDRISFDERGKKVLSFPIITAPEALHAALCKGNALYHPTIMFRNTKEATYREKFHYAQDYDLYLNLMSRDKKIVNLPFPVIEYVVSAHSVSFSERPKQRLFAGKALEFYEQRLSSGKDEYDSFDPSDILSVDTRDSRDPYVLRTEMEACLEMHDFASLRGHYRKYLGCNKRPDKYIFFYLLSFFPAGIVDVFRRASRSIRSLCNPS